MRNADNSRNRANFGFLRYVTFPLVGMSLLLASMSASANECPQQRDTEYAPAYLASKQNPLPFSDDLIDDAEDLYEDDVQPVACAACHGEKGDGDGVMARMFSPAPRNFTCGQTMHEVADGQLFWVIKNGSIGTSMPAFDKLSDEEIWKLVHYIRQFAPMQDSSSMVSQVADQGD